MVSFRIQGSEKPLELEGLVDTGSDYTLLPIALANTMGIRTDDEPVEMSGIGIGRIQVYFAEVILELGKKGHKGVWTPRGWKWKAWVGFGITPRIILGQDGFLHYFNATFTARPRIGLQDPPEQQLDLKPNSMFQNVRVP